MVSISLHAADDGISSASVYLNPFDVSDVIEQFELWNDKIETKQAALDFYHELNQVCNHLFHNPLKLMITHEEFNNLTLESIKQLNRDALATLRDQVSETSFN